MSNKHLSEESLRLKTRMLELSAVLARMKSDFFNDGIEQPLRVRAKLEAELAELAVKRGAIDQAHFSREARIRERRAVLVKQKLTELGQPSLLDDCLAQARMEIALQEKDEIAL